MNGTAKNTGVYLLGTVLTALLGFAGTMLLTRILSGQVYAMYGLLTSWSAASVNLLSLGVDAAYTRFYYAHSTTRRRFLQKCLLAPLLAFAGFAVLLCEPSQRLLQGIFAEHFSAAVCLFLLLGLLAALLQRFGRLTARMEGSAVHLSAADCLSKAGFLAIAAAIYALRGTVSFGWLAAAFALSGIFAVGIYARLLCRLPNLSGTAAEDTGYRSLFRYGLPYLVHNTLILLIPMGERLLIRAISGWEVLRLYTAASIFSTVVLLLSNLLDNLWLPVVYRRYTDPAFRPLLHRFGLAVTALTTFGLGGCILLRRWLVLLLDGSYREVAVIAPAVVYAACLDILANIYGIGISLRKKTVHLLVSPVLQLACAAGLCIALLPQYGLRGAGLAVLLSVLISRLYRVIVGLRLYGTGRREGKAAALWLVSALFSAAALFFTSFTADLLLCATLCAAALLLLHPELRAICQSLFSFFRKGR